MNGYKTNIFVSFIKNKREKGRLNLTVSTTQKTDKKTSPDSDIIKSLLLSVTGSSVADLVQVLSRIIAFLLLMMNSAFAEDTLSTVMQRMKSDTAVKIAYQEIRQLELIEQPWLGSGYIYSMPPDLIIREQRQPERVLMGVKGNDMFYFDTTHDVRYQGKMDMDNPMSLNIAVFKALINADEALLHSLYETVFSNTDQRWMLTLTAKQNAEQGFSVMVSGLPNQQADMIITHQADGDSSEFILKADAKGDEVETTVTRLYQELLGD